MKKQTIYTCCMCGAHYLDEIECVHCENSHAVPITCRVSASAYKKRFYMAKYPEKIIVIFGDGKELLYKCDGENQ